MGQQLGVGAGVVLLIGLIVLIAVIAAGQRKKIAAAIKAIADANPGFSFADNGLERQVLGKRDGREVKLYIAPEGGRPNGLLEQKWQISLRSTPEGKIGATKNGWRAAISPGSTRVETGDSAFDKKVLLEGTSPENVKGWLTDTRKAALAALIDAGGIFYDGRVMLTKQGLETKPGVLVGRFTTLWAAAEQLDAG
jgi:hypothetical protein